MNCQVALLACFAALFSHDGKLETVPEGCGQRAMMLAATILGDESIRAALSQTLPEGEITSLADLERAARQAGLKTRSMVWPERRFPTRDSGVMIVAIRDSPKDRIGHFVLLARDPQRNWMLLDFPRSPRAVSEHKLTEHWNGVALHLALDDGALASMDRSVWLWPWLAPVGFCLALVGSVCAVRSVWMRRCAIRTAVRHA